MTMTRQKETPAVASARPKRTPINNRQRLVVRNKEDGYVYRIVNANLEKDPDRVERFLEAGYEIVTKDQTGPVGDKRVDNPTAPGSASMLSVGGGTKAVVMRIREDWFKEDQASKQAELDAIEATMKSDKADYGTIKRNSGFKEPESF